MTTEIIYVRLYGHVFGRAGAGAVKSKEIWEEYNVVCRSKFRPVAVAFYTGVDEDVFRVSKFDNS